MITNILTVVLLAGSFIAGALFLRLTWHTFFLTYRTSTNGSHPFLRGLSVMFAIGAFTQIFWPVVLWGIPAIAENLVTNILFQTVAIIVYIAAQLFLSIGLNLWWNRLLGIRFLSLPSKSMSKPKPNPEPESKQKAGDPTLQE